MPRSLREYLDKRDAARTNEPMGGEPTGGLRAPTWRGAFVVHQHDATRMHFDLRLEVGGVLASFAVPHGISLDPQDKHLAMQTEDHPIEYLDFEAVIPDGSYGAGPMIAWDLGSVRYLDAAAEEGLAEGKLHFSLEGRKLRGRYGLVRLKPKGGRAAGKEWLLIKKADAHAAQGRDLAAELPRSVLSGLTVSELADAPSLAARVRERAAALGAKGGVVQASRVSPMLCTLAEELPEGSGWLYELKMDGVRAIADKSDAGATIFYRSGREATASYPEIARAVRALAPRRVMLDGELVSFDDAGKPSFERLATRIHKAPRAELRHALAEVPVVFVVFDLLGLDDLDCRTLPLAVRKSLLAELIPAPSLLRVLDHLEGDGQHLLEFCRDNGLEGVVSKRADSPYVEGPGRTSHWLKTKCNVESCFVVVGYTEGEGSRRSLGALEVASYEGDTLVLRGRVGSGLNDARIEDLLKRLAPLERESPAAIGRYEAAKVRTHVAPELVVRVRYLEWSEEGSLRHPVFVGLEHDVDPRSCTAAPHDEEHAAGAQELPPQAEPAIEVAITNRSKVFWPDDGTTKGDLVDYYDSVADVMLPYLEDRPVMLVRYPDGIEGKSFYQWNVPHGMPSWVRSVSLGKHVSSPDEGDSKKQVFIIDRRESLLYVANLGCIPIHILASRVASPSDCDFLTIDFDVNRSSFAVATTLALTLRGLLDEVGLTGFPKTSGQTGLHVFVPLAPGVTPIAARTLAELLGRMIEARHPSLATMERVVERRGQRVYVDTGQTGPSRTIVAPFSVRATRGARVSTPITWQELEAGVDPAALTIRTVPARVRERGDPMRPLLSVRPDMSRVTARLAALVGPRA